MPTSSVSSKAKVKSVKPRAGMSRIPPFRPVQLATLVEEVPSGTGWLHEMKWDGYRCLIAVGGLDAYKPERWAGDAVFFPETRELYRRLVAQGWTDSLRKMHPSEAIYTYWGYFRNAFARNAGLRMDHLLLSPTLAPRLAAADVDRQVRAWDKTSDHAPTWVELACGTSKTKKRGGRGQTSSATTRTGLEHPRFLLNT